jgi:hypothetical protein
LYQLINAIVQNDLTSFNDCIKRDNINVNVLTPRHTMFNFAFFTPLLRLAYTGKAERERLDANIEIQPALFVQRLLDAKADPHLRSGDSGKSPYQQAHEEVIIICSGKILTSCVSYVYL